MTLLTDYFDAFDHVIAVARVAGSVLRHSSRGQSQGDGLAACHPIGSRTELRDTNRVFEESTS